MTINDVIKATHPKGCAIKGAPNGDVLIGDGAIGLSRHKSDIKWAISVPVEGPFAAFDYSAPFRPSMVLVMHYETGLI